MPGVTLRDEFRAALEEILVPEMRAIQESLRELRDDVWRLRAATLRLLRAEVHRLDGRIDLVDRELRRPLPCARLSPRCRAARRRG